ncbi:hypothetical protein XENOCAPTIV_008959 [Xenoophorus captivus]|uniref:Uncharacterized protein n=1 Tax=Xenoophorus captivus TaxID=1517983 RepID=A0ABV0QLL0_9TELE
MMAATLDFSPAEVKTLKKPSVHAKVFIPPEFLHILTCCNPKFHWDFNLKGYHKAVVVEENKMSFGNLFGSKKGYMMVCIFFDIVFKLWHALEYSPFEYILKYIHLYLRLQLQVTKVLQGPGTGTKRRFVLNGIKEKPQGVDPTVT